MTEVGAEETPASTPGSTELAVDAVVVPSWRPPLDPDDAGYRALRASVRASGVVEPLVVRPASGGGHELISGLRRLRAAAAAGEERVPVLVLHMDNRAAMLAAWDGVERSRLAPAEHDELRRRLVEEGFDEETVGRLCSRLRTERAQASPSASADAATGATAAPAPQRDTVVADARDVTLDSPTEPRADALPEVDRSTSSDRFDASAPDDRGEEGRVDDAPEVVTIDLPGPEAASAPESQGSSGRAETTSAELPAEPVTGLASDRSRRGAVAAASGTATAGRRHLGRSQQRLAVSIGTLLTVWAVLFLVITVALGAQSRVVIAIGTAVAIGGVLILATGLLLDRRSR